MRKVIRPRRRPRNLAPESAADLMHDVLARIGGEDRAVELRVFAAWEEAVGPVLGQRVRPEGVRGKTLLVKCDSSAFAHEVTLLRREILERLARTVGADLLTDLRTRVGG